MRKRILLLVVAVALVAFAVTGCGGSKTSGGGGGGQVVLKIGIGAPLTDGAVALGKGMERATQLAVAQANESAELKKLNIKLETVSGDDRGDPKTGLNVATQFVSTKGLVAVMGHLNSGVSIPASKEYNKADIVQISPASTNPELTLLGRKNVFRVCTIDSVQGPAAADDAVKKLGKKAAFVVDDSTPYGTGLAAEFAKQFAADGGKVLGTEKTSDKDTDFKALVTKIKAANPDLIYYGGIYNSGALLSKQLKEAGVKAPLMGGDGLYDPEFVKLAGAANAEGDYATSVGLPIDQLPKGAEFKDAFKKMFPNDEIAAYDAYSYDAANVIIAAIEKVATDLGADKVDTPEGKKAIIAAVAATDTEGVTGKIAFDANGDTVNKAITLYVVKGGVWTPAQ